MTFTGLFAAVALATTCMGLETVTPSGIGDKTAMRFIAPPTMYFTAGDMRVAFGFGLEQEGCLIGGP